MRTLYIIKTGSTFAAIRQQHGDFEQWMQAGLRPKHVLPAERPAMAVIDATANGHGPLGYPEPDACAGVVISGSHDMVTDDAPWMQELEQWLLQICQAGVPVLGICFGHQLLGHALGGVVGPNPKGLELGTVSVEATPAATTDALWQDLAPVFAANAVHYQSVLQPPPGAVVLARNAHEDVHAFRVGAACWGVQFHPEFNTEAMQGYIAHLQPAPAQAAATPDAAALLARFAAYADCSAS